jgi:hypothetical protein
VPVIVNSNRFAHGTRPAASARSATAATWITQARIVSAKAARWYRVALVVAGAGGAFSATAVVLPFDPSEARPDAAAGATACALAARLARSSTNAMNAMAYTAMAEYSATSE